MQNLDAWVHSFLRRHKYDHTIVFNRRKGAALEAWNQAMALQDSKLGLPATFYEEEFEHVILAQGVSTRDDYRQAKRRGRGTILTRAKRDAIWPLYKEYRAQLASRKLKEVEDAYRDAAVLLKDKPASFSSIVVDETQDFGPQALRLLRAMVPPQANDLFFVGDGHQRIYNRNRASMTACGIDIRGRSKKLYLNYRTTEEIRRVAVALLEGCEVDDLDEGCDEVKRYKSISHGPKPTMIEVAHIEGALSAIVPMVEDALKEGRSICAIVPTRHDADAVHKALKSAKISATLIGPEERDHHDSKAPRVATMHRAKGLEFDEVLLLARKAQDAANMEASDTKRLLYVGITRAKRLATVIRY